METRYLLLKNGHFEQINQDYLNHLYRLKMEANFEKSNGLIFRGKITGISSLGRLIIEHSEGQEEFDLKEKLNFYNIYYNL